MTDLEQRLHDSLVSAAHEAPAPDDLAGAARARLRRRRRTVAAAVASVAAVVVAVPAALTLGGDEPDDHTAVDPGPAAEGTVPDGWRMVTAQGLSVLVPEQWQEGARPAWCAGGGGRPEQPLVQLPGQVVDLIACHHPTESLGVTIGSASAARPAYESGHVWRYEQGTGPDGVEYYLDGSWLGYWYDDERLVSVNAADRETVERVLASVDTGWTTAEHDGVTVDLPPGWVAKDQTGCEWEFPSFGPPTADPCDPDAEGVSFYASATFDPADGPGLRRGEDGWSGYAYAGDYAVYVHVADRQVGQRILDSREPAR